MSEVEILQNAEKKLLSALCLKDVTNLCGELLKLNLISKTVNDSFGKLDRDNLDVEVRIRYLLQHVHDKVKQNCYCFHSFMEVLLRLDLNDMCETLREELRRWSFLNDIDTASQLGNSSQAKKRSRISLGSKILHENDVCILTIILIKASHKWEEIGLSLRLFQYEVEECRKDGSNPVRLSNVLRRWLTSAHNSAEPPTLDALSRALGSGVVGETSLADQLIERFIEKIKEYLTSKPKRKRLHNPLMITYQSVDIEVTSGKSALLEVRVESSNPVNYQWRKNSEELSSGKLYSGVNNSVLFIYSVKLETQGRYSCCVCSEDEKVYSDDINLMVTFPEITSYFFEVYSRLDELPIDSWPPVAAKTFINLALIMKSKSDSNVYDYTVQGDIDDIIEAKEKIEYLEVFGKYESGALVLIEGRPGSGKTTLMHKVTRDWAVKKDVLVGAKLVFLIPLRLFSSLSNDIDLSDIVQYYIASDKKRKKVMTHMETFSGEGVCFLVDGLDEYQLRDDRNTTIYKLLRKRLLPNSMVIVASRPIGSAKLRMNSRVTKRVEVLGFSKTDVFSYIGNYMFEDVGLTSKLEKYLNDHNKVLHMCYLPVHTAMICYLYSQLGDDIPQTETKMYENFTLHTIVRKLRRENHDMPIGFVSLSELDGDVKVCFNKICELAFKMTLYSKQAIRQKDTNVLLSLGSSDGPSLGLVTIDCTANLFNIEDFYTYHHLTFQEYLTAVHIAWLDEDQQLKVIEKYKDSPQFLMVWRFFCGTVEFSNRNSQVEKLLSSVAMDTPQKVMCGFESQQQVVCDCILQSNSLFFEDIIFSTSDFLGISYVITHSVNILTKLELDECKLNEEGVSLLVEHLTSDHFKTVKYLGYHKTNCTIAQFKLLSKLLRNFLLLESLNLKRTELSVNGVMELTRGVDLKCLRLLKVHMPLKQAKSENKVLQYLRFASTELNEVQFDCTKSYVQGEEVMKYFKILYDVFGVSVRWNPKYHIINNETGHVHLEHFSNCCDVVLVNCCIQDHQVEVLVIALLTYNKLRTLRLDFNHLSGKGATLLASSFDMCNTIEEFSAHCNQIDDCGALALAKALVRLKKPRVLDLQCNAITEAGLSAITEVTRHLTEFQLYITIQATQWSKSNISCVNIQSLRSSLDTIRKGSPQAQLNALKCCKFVPEIYFNDNASDNELKIKWTGTDMVALADGLKFCNNTVVLNISNNSMNLEATSALAHALKYCTNLKKLLLPFNSICSDGAVALAGALKCCTNLKQLDLDVNDIGSDGAVALAGALKCCTSLEQFALGRNDIGSDGAVALAGALKCCTSLEQLDLDDNDIGSNGAVTLADTLKSSTNLKVLILNGNNIGSEGTVALANALKSCTSLEQVYLGCNDIGSDGAVALAGALKCCTSLEQLLLDDNDIGSNGAVTVADALKSCSSLQGLQLNGNNIGSDGAVALADALKCCTGLKVLCLNGNNIGSDGAVALAGALKRCTSLEQLDLNGNNIGSDGAVALADALKCCTGLKVLCLNGNNIGSDGAVALAGALKCCTSLEQLLLDDNDIGSNGAVTVADALKSCSSLQGLQLNGNNIGSDGAVALADALKCCTGLKVLCLNGNNIGSDGAVALAGALKRCTSLEQLDLNGNNIGSDGAVALAGALKCCTSLEQLLLDDNDIGSNGAVTVADALKSCSSLQGLQLNGNNIGSDGAVALADALKCCTGLKVLCLNGNNIGSDGAVALAGALKRCTSLEQLDLNGNNIGSDGAVALAGALKRCTSLEQLDLEGNDIGSDGAVALAGALKCCTSLEQLDLDDNDIGSNGAVTLADALKSCSSLQMLHLNGNNIGSDGVVALADALKSCTSLAQLYLDGNNIGSNGAVALGGALKSCTSLQVLDLIGNNIDSDGAVALADALKCCTSLKVLNLNGNNIGSDSAVALDGALKHCTSLEQLYLVGNNIGSNGAVALAEGLKYCTNLQTLDLSCNSIGSDGAVALAEGVKCCTNLQTLNLSHNNIGSDGAVALAEELKCSTNLQTLNLRSNSISSDDAVALAEGAKCWTNLQILNECECLLLIKLQYCLHTTNLDIFILVSLVLMVWVS